jgi:hypothetical protein
MGGVRVCVCVCVCVCACVDAVIYSNFKHKLQFIFK